MNRNSEQQGVTLLELLITVAIVAILAAIAVPSYQAYVARSHRAEAKAVLLENAQFLERNFTLSNKYDETSAGGAVSIPITQSPRDGAAVYTIATTVFSDTQFELTATPVVNGPMDGDGCGNLTYNQQGTKGRSGVMSVDECWNR